MTISKLQALSRGTAGNSTGDDVANAVNALIDETEDLRETINNIEVAADLVTNYGGVGDAVYNYEVDGSLTISSGTDNTTALLAAMADFADGTITALTVPGGNFWVDSSQIDCPTGTTIVGAGSNATKFIMSTTNPNLNLFVGFYQGNRVSNLHYSGFKVIGSKVNDNTIGGTSIFTLGTDGVTGGDLACEGSKGLLWLGNDNVVGGKLYGTRNVYMRNLRVDDCKLFSVYVRGNENPNVLALPENDTNNINIDGLTIRGSNTALAIAEGYAYGIRIKNYDSRYNDNLLQIESCSDVVIDGIWLSNATSVWNTNAPSPFKLQWLIAGAKNVTIKNGYIDAELQSFAFPLNSRGCTNINFVDITGGDFTRFTTLGVQNGVDTNKNMFSQWSFTRVYLPRNGISFFQTAATGIRPLMWWRDWSWSDCNFENDSVNNPIISEACAGNMVFDDKCVFNGKPPRALKGQKITFNAMVRANGVIGSSIQFTAMDDVDPLDQTVLRIGGNFQIEGEVKDVDFDIVHDNGTYDVRNQSAQCRTSDATEFNNHGMTFYRFTGDSGFVSEGIADYKALQRVNLPTIAGQNSSNTLYTGTGTSLPISTGLDATAAESLVLAKCRSDGDGWFLADSLSGVGKYISTSQTSAQASDGQSVTAFTASGVTLGTTARLNTSTRTYVMYHFLEAEGFLDIVEDVGTGVAKTISHDLGTDVGCIISKNLTDVSDWAVYYHSLSVGTGAALKMTTAGVVIDSAIWNSTVATDTEFSVGTSNLTNGSGDNIIYYLFAKNVCHSYSATGASGLVVNFGYKAKTIIIKRATAATTGNYIIYDNARDSSDSKTLRLLLNAASVESAVPTVVFTDTGIIINSTVPDLNAAGSSYLIIAIPEI